MDCRGWCWAGEVPANIDTLAHMTESHQRQNRSRMSRVHAPRRTSPIGATSVSSAGRYQNGSAGPAAPKAAGCPRHHCLLGIARAALAPANPHAPAARPVPAPRRRAGPRGAQPTLAQPATQATNTKPFRLHSVIKGEKFGFSQFNPSKNFDSNKSMRCTGPACGIDATGPLGTRADSADSMRI
jgi:hypothetical protein